MGSGILLDERLDMIARMIEPCGCVADIGTDHGLLGAHLLQSGKAGRVQFMDVSAGSLKKARGLIDRLGLQERASFAVGDGAEPIQGNVDAVVIAGMGGLLIADIVERGQDKLRHCALIMQPNIAQAALRERLMRLGFRIERERIAHVSGRLYVIIAARSGEAKYDRRELLIGPCLLRDGDPLLMAYAGRRLAVARRALEGATQGDAPWRDELAWECECWEGIVHGGEG